MSRLVLLAAACLAALPAAASASDAKEPYKVRIVVAVAEHRLLTDVFREQLQRELKDGMQAALGKLAKVEVTDKHDKLADVRADGLQKALDGYRARSGEKVYFVLVDFDGTRYEIQTRQYDGDLQVPSPTVRRERTRDRAYVARAAALLMEKDVGLTGTIVSEPDAGRRVKVEWRGGDLGVDLARWLKKGEILAVANPRPGAGEATLAWTLLQIETTAANGSSTCVLFSRYKMPRATGLRCVLIGTRSGPLRLRLLEQKRGGGFKELEQAVTLQFRHHGFEGEDGSVRTITGGANGEVIDTAENDKEKGRFARVAFVTMLSNDTVKARIPIALIGDRQVTVPVPADDETTNEALERYLSLARNTLSAAQVLADQFTEVNALTKDQTKLAEALARVRQTLKRSQEDYKRLRDERDEVAKEIEKLPEKGRRPSFQAIDARLNQLSAAEKELSQHVTVLEGIERTEKDPKRKAALLEIERAKGLEKDADVEEAIAAYKKVPKEFYPQGLEKHVAALEKQWKPADAAHAQARRFLYKTYPALKTADLAAKWKDVESAFTASQKAGDRWGLIRLLKASEKHRDRATGEANALKPHLNPDDEKPAKQIADVLTKLVKLIDDATASLDRLKS